MIRAAAIGWKAHAALEAVRAPVRALAVLSESVYLTVGDTLVWLGRADATLHPRAVLTGDPLPASADADIRIDAGGLAPWTTAPLPSGAGTAARLARGARALHAALGAIGRPEGLGLLLAGTAPPFPLDGAARHARTLAAACAAGDPDAAAEAARPLLGLGPGLTPSGDDLVGGVFFARAVLAGGPRREGWRRAAATVRACAHARTHPISAALLEDMLAGHAHAPLHDLVLALASDVEPARALAAARRLVRLGHSSGWDMLAGLVAGLAPSLLAEPDRARTGAHAVE